MGCTTPKMPVRRERKSSRTYPTWLLLVVLPVLLRSTVRLHPAAVDAFALTSPATTTSLRVVRRRPHAATPTICKGVTSPIQSLSLHCHTEECEDVLPESPRPEEVEKTIWEQLALLFVGDDVAQSAETMTDYVQLITVFRVGIPAFVYATTVKLLYPMISSEINAAINDSGVFAVVAQDASQYIQNILTTSGLVFSLLVGQTYYFMYQQQEATYLALYEEVTVAKSLLEQVALVCQGRQQLYQRILIQMDRYCKEDLQRFNDIEPAILLSARPCDDPLEDILYLTSVGEPSMVYQTVRSLRQARAFRLAALQRKLPSIHMTLLWVLAGIVLFTFPLLGAGVLTIGGQAILQVQSWYIAFIVFGMSITMGVIYELQRPGESGAYNARTVLAVMVAGLEEELKERLDGRDNFDLRAYSSDMDFGPSIDSDGAFDVDLLKEARSGNYDI